MTVQKGMIFNGRNLSFFFLLLAIFNSRTKTELTANIVDEDPAGCQRWIFRKEI